MQKLPGGLVHVNVVGCALFAAISGSSAATVATVGKMSIPELRKVITLYDMMHIHICKNYTFLAKLFV